jgi:secreted PhoX family phosphatase
MHDHLTFGQRLEADDDVAVNRSTERPFESILAARLSQIGTPAGVAATAVGGVVAASLFSGKTLSRRGLMKGAAASVALAGAAGALGTAIAPRTAHAAEGVSTLTFPPLPHSYDENSHVAEGYEIQTLIRWGDPVVAGAPDFDPMNQTAEAQSKQFGYNNDFVGFMPLPVGSNTSDHGLLCVNHEYTNPDLMFPGSPGAEDLTAEQIDIEMAAHGHAVVEIKRDGNTWSVVKDSPLNRRFTALETEFELTGPAAGSDRLKTSYDSTGTKVIGTVNNCAGGKTPWGTILFAEENFHGYFMGDVTKTAEAENYERYGVGGGRYAWGNFHDRFNVEKEPNEANRFGWMVEFDPYDPNSVPKKRTTLGRFKHEGATTALDKSGHVVVYAGDDQRFEYVYRFVTAGTYNPDDRAANMDLLDEGTLSVAKFNEDGTLNWMPLVFGEGPLTPENGINSQADILIDTRKAADLVGATPMDRPEDVEPNPVNGIIYAMMTNNTKREADQINVANTRAHNRHGHVVEIIPPGTAPDGDGANADHTADQYTWDIFLLAGDPSKPEDGAMYGGDVGENGWLSCPDNVAFDSKGRIWISTDGAPKVGVADGVWAADVHGPGRAITRRFYACPQGAELCGPEFTPDDSTYFAAVQHPADEKGSTFENPSTRWPDFDENMPARPSVQVLVKTGGGPIG